MRFTVVVPTRQRCDTLSATLRTCVEQATDNLTIVVSDNHSTDATRDVVASFSDPRIRYRNTGRRLSMSRNWEFALDAVDDSPDNFVLYLGDDDGLLPSALTDVAALIADTRTAAVAWRKAEYSWPSAANESHRNLATVPLENHLTRYTGTIALRDVKNLWLPYYRCPSLYNSFVSAAAVHSIRRRDGQFFHSSIPDAYSGYAVLGAVSWYLYSSRPFAVNGASSHSTGASFGAGSRNAGPREQFLAEDDLPQHKKLRVIPGSTVLAAIESLYQANDHVFDGHLRILRPYVIASFFREISVHSPKQWAATVDALEDFAHRGDDRGFELYVRFLRWYFHRRRTALVRTDDDRQTGCLDEAHQLLVDLSRYGVTDVHGAAAWIGNLLGPYRAPESILEYRTSDKLRTRGAAWVARRVRDWTL